MPEDENKAPRKSRAKSLSSYNKESTPKREAVEKIQSTNQLTGKSFEQEAKEAPSISQGNMASGTAVGKTAKYVESFEGYDIDYQQDDWEKQRAENQSNWVQAGNAIVQLVAGEIIGGTIENAGNLMNLANWGDVIKGDEELATNFLSELGHDIKEGVSEAAPIYQENPGEFDMTDPAWYAQGVVSAGSSLAMMFPSGRFSSGIHSTTSEKSCWKSLAELTLE